MRSIQFSIILLSLALALLGMWMVPRLQFNFQPNYGQRSISISYIYPAASAEIVEQALTTPIEGGVSLIRGVKHIKSEANRGRGYTRVEIEEDADIDQVRFEIAQMMRQLYRQFPVEVPYPQILLNDPDSKQLDPTLVSYSYSGIRESHELFRYVTDVLSPKLSTVDGVYEIRVDGTERIEWHISYRASQLQSIGIDPREIQTMIREYLFEAGLTYVRDGLLVHYAKLTPLELEGLLQQVLPLSRGGIIKYIALSDIIDIRQSTERPRRHYRVNGQKSITLNFIPDQHANHLQTAARIRQAIEDLRPSLPQGTYLTLGYDTTQYISDELKKIRDRTVWSLGILIIFVVMTYRNLRRIGLLILALLTNLGIASLGYHLWDVQLNLYALAAVTVSFGLIIDNIIVVAHHYQREGDLKISPALVTSTLTTLAALLIIFLLPEKLQWELIDFAKVLVINLCVSLAVSLLLVPAIIDRYGRQGNQGTQGIVPQASKSRYGIIVNQKYRSMIYGMRTKRTWLIAALILLFGLPVFWLPKEVAGWSWYNRTVGSDVYQEHIKPWVNRGLGGSLRLFTQYVYEGSVYRTSEETILYVGASMPEGSSLEQMNELISHMEQYLNQYMGEIKSYVTSVHSGQAAQIRITFPRDGSYSFPYKLKNRVQSAAIDLGGVQWNIYGVGRGFSNSSISSAPAFKIGLKGYNKDQLRYWSQQLAELILEHPRVQKVDIDANLNWWEKDQHLYDLSVNPSQLAAAGWSMSGMQQLLQSYHKEAPVIHYNRHNQAIRLINEDQHQNDMWDLRQKQHMNGMNALRLTKVARLQKEKVSNAIHKEDQQYLQMIGFEYIGSERFGQQHLDACLETFVPTLPLGNSVEQYGYNFWGSTQKKQYGLIALVIGLIFFICTIHFESFKAAFLIVLLIPMSFVGIFLTFYGFGYTFDQGGYISFLLLSGLVVNSLILILSDYYRYRRSFPWRRPIDLYLRAYRGKITPITLTILSTALGLLPFTMHGSQEVFWFSLAVGTIGGLVFSLMLILLFVPLFITTDRD